MKLKEVKVTPYVRLGYCEKCGGKLVATGTTFLTYPAIYEYKCESCGNLEESTIKLNEVFYKEDEEVHIP